jgi:uncharacterized protein involved in outer membrane biogenesis
VLKKSLLVGVGIVLIVGLGLYFWANSVLGTEAVRSALASQISQRVGQPVTIGGISATVYPRTSITLREVGIGPASEIRVASLDVGTDFRALLSRKVEHGSLHLDGARISLPLPPLTLGSGQPSAGGDESSAVEIASIDEVVLSDVQIVSGGRTLRGDIEVVPQGNGLVIERVALGTGDMALTVTGTLTDLAGPVGDLSLESNGLDFDQLIAFANDFIAGAGSLPASPTAATSPSSQAPAPAARPMHVTVNVKADGATMGGLAIDKVTARAVATGQAISLEPLSFGLFGGSYEGALDVSLAQEPPAFHWTARLSNIDVAAAAAFAGSPDTVSGRLAATVDFTGSGADAATAMKTVHGTTRIDVTDGVVRRLGLVRAVGAATALSAEGLRRAASTTSEGSDEPFSRLGATISIADGAARTEDLQFDADDLSLTATGSVQLATLALDLHGRIQLSEALSQQSNRTLMQVSGDSGRLTLPAVITGTAAQPSVKIDVGDMRRRALENAADKAKKEGTEILKRNLGGLLRR